MTDKKKARTADGTPVTDQTIQRLADEAETGYDTAALRRKGGRKPIGSAAASVVPAPAPRGVDPDLAAGGFAHAAISGCVVLAAVP